MDVCILGNYSVDDIVHKWREVISDHCAPRPPPPPTSLSVSLGFLPQLVSLSLIPMAVPWVPLDLQVLVWWWGMLGVTLLWPNPVLLVSVLWRSWVCCFTLPLLSLHWNKISSLLLSEVTLLVLSSGYHQGSPFRGSWQTIWKLCWTWLLMILCLSWTEWWDRIVGKGGL